MQGSAWTSSSLEPLRLCTAPDGDLQRDPPGVTVSSACGCACQSTKPRGPSLNPSPATPLRERSSTCVAAERHTGLLFPPRFPRRDPRGTRPGVPSQAKPLNSTWLKNTTLLQKQKLIYKWNRTGPGLCPPPRETAAAMQFTEEPGLTMAREETGGEGSGDRGDRCAGLPHPQQPGSSSRAPTCPGGKELWFPGATLALSSLLLAASPGARLWLVSRFLVEASQSTHPASLPHVRVSLGSRFQGELSLRNG